MTGFAILCPGQGSQTSTMFDLVVAEPAGRAVVAAFDDALGIDVVTRAHADDDLFANAYAQPAFVASAIATWAVLAPRLPEPALFAGYSVGEVSAWSCAGAWTVANAARVTAARAAAMDARSPPRCGMLAVRGLPRDDIATLAPGLDVAIVNDHDHVVLAGPDAAIDAAMPALAAHGAWTRRLDVRVPSHTRFLADAATDLRATLAELPPRDVDVPVLRGVDGVPCRRGGDAAEALPRAVHATIRWDDCMRTLAESGVRVALELGPGRALAGLCAVGCPDVVVRSVADFRTFDGIERWVLRSLEG